MPGAFSMCASCQSAARAASASTSLRAGDAAPAATDIKASIDASTHFIGTPCTNARIAILSGRGEFMRYQQSWIVLWAFAGTAIAAAAPIPEVVTRNGRAALMVDGAPYLVLGAQVNNSSAWEPVLPKVW